MALPLLAEQKRIADKLDTVLTRVDAVNTRLARVAPLLKRFRQSVLAAATSGRLTEDWRGGAGRWIGPACPQQKFVKRCKAVERRKLVLLRRESLFSRSTTSSISESLLTTSLSLLVKPFMSRSFGSRRCFQTMYS